MSSFCGLMREYTECSLDRFDGVNLKSTAFFLSHCHQGKQMQLKPKIAYYRQNCFNRFEIIKAFTFV